MFRPTFFKLISLTASSSLAICTLAVSSLQFMTFHSFPFCVDASTRFCLILGKMVVICLPVIFLFLAKWFYFVYWLTLFVEVDVQPLDKCVGFAFPHVSHCRCPVHQVIWLVPFKNDLSSMFEISLCSHQRKLHGKDGKFIVHYLFFSNKCNKWYIYIVLLFPTYQSQYLFSFLTVVTCWCAFKN